MSYLRLSRTALVAGILFFLLAIFVVHVAGIRAEAFLWSQMISIGLLAPLAINALVAQAFSRERNEKANG